MKVIFLDFDGVLNSEASFRYEARRKSNRIPDSLSDVCCSNLQYILEQAADVKLVISSTWRKMHTMEELRNFLNGRFVNGSRIVSKTPSVFSGHRGHEIKLWLQENPNVTQYVILDDDNDAITALYNEEGKEDDKRGHFFQTTPEDGLLFKQAKQIAKLFRGEK
jgi:K+/H+ antiporter YhaU regulatory subunit KhtT